MEQTAHQQVITRFTSIDRNNWREEVRKREKLVSEIADVLDKHVRKGNYDSGITQSEALAILGHTSAQLFGYWPLSDQRFTSSVNDLLTMPQTKVPVGAASN